jgi:nucleotide-binding universal stress UspA family protein
VTLLVPFDGSALAEAALKRAETFGVVFDQPVVAVCIVPKENAGYARERGWLDPGEPFDVERITDRLRDKVADCCPTATFQYETVPRYAQTGTVAKRLRGIARDAGASMVFIGSENAGRLVTSLSSVGGTVAADSTYDVVIVRHTDVPSFERAAGDVPAE